MEAVAAAGSVLETLAEGTAAIYKGLTVSTAPLKATFRRLKAPHLPRSSHTLCVVGGRAYIFGGESNTDGPPTDNDMHIVTLPSAELQEADYQAVGAKAAGESHASVPEARVGHAAAVIGSRLYVFGGAGGTSKKPLEENGRVWVYDTLSNRWSHLDPASNAPFPSARSYHSAAASERPSPNIPPPASAATEDLPSKSPEATTTSLVDDAPSENPEPPPSDTYGTLFIHGGTLSSGQRTSDAWAFDISSRSWSPFPDAPDPPRSGTSLNLVKDRLYRFGGTDGSRALGGVFDYLDISSGSFEDKGGKGEMSLSPEPPGEWRSNAFPVGSENNGGPDNRADAGVVYVSTGQGRNYLLVLCGHGPTAAASTDKFSDAASLLDDAWAFQLKPEGATAAAAKDAARGVALGRETGEAKVSEVKYYYDGGGSEDVKMVQEGQDRPVGKRALFACAGMGDAALGGTGDVLVWGGVDADGKGLGDAWVVSVE
ncbi:MAG: hypothetical protein M1831_000411 [Alyxoria varia]|nr:MAG: hypothetical protein M1831_000411 [Alyxoria varia]